MKMDINTNPDAVNYVVKLNGEQVNNVVSVDTEEGWLEVRVTDRNGKLLLDGTNPYGSVTRKLHGEIELLRIGSPCRSVNDPSWIGVIEAVPAQTDPYAKLDL